MLAPVTDAIRSFRSRLRWAAFVRGATAGVFGCAVGLAGLLLADRFLLPEWSLEAVAPAWTAWALVAAGGLLGGVVARNRQCVDDDVVVAHLEKRLGTHGLLLVAGQGAEMDQGFRDQLARALVRTESVLPVIRWDSLWLRPVAAIALLVIVQALPAPRQDRPAAEALSVATRQLDDELRALDERQAVSDERIQELRQAATELKERAAAGESGLWREVDQLRERIAREHKLADSQEGSLAQQSGANAGADGSAAGGAGSAQANASPGARSTPASATELAEGIAELTDLDPRALQDIVDHLPELSDEQRAAIAGAMGEDGSVDAAALPDDPEARSALMDAIAKVADGMAADADKLAELADAMPGVDADALAERLADLAGEMQAADESPAVAGAENAGESAAQELGSEPGGELGAELAKTALEMAKAGALDNLPDGLKDAMMEAGMSALESLDVEQLLKLLPDDLSELQSMAETVAKLAESMGRDAGGPQERSERGGSEGGGQSGPDLPKMSKEMQAKMMGLAKSLMEKAGKLSRDGRGGQGEGALAGGNPSSAKQPGGNQPGSGRPGPGQGPAGSGPRSGTGTEGGGHAALRMTEDTEGGVSSAEMVLPEQDPDDLPTEWVPLSVEKATPEVGDRKAASAGRAGATGRGGASWQLRLMPRHREIVRRFFGEKKK